jgi:hypothetical protein
MNAQRCDNENVHVFCNYRFSQLEERVTRIEKLIFGAVLSTALLGLSIIWLVIDLPNRLMPHGTYEKNNEQHHQVS